MKASPLWYAIFADTDYKGGRACFAITTTPLATAKQLKSEFDLWFGYGHIQTYGPFDSAADAARFEES